MSRTILSIESLASFKTECRQQEKELYSGRCQLCLDAFLLTKPVPGVDDDDDVFYGQDLHDHLETPLKATGDVYLNDLVARCPSIKIICPANVSFNGQQQHLDLSHLRACINLELVRIPFTAFMVGAGDQLRNQLRTLIWQQSLSKHDNMSSVIGDQHHQHQHQPIMNIDELFWDRFGAWPSLTKLRLTHNALDTVNASSMPYTIQVLELQMNRLADFGNIANYSRINMLTRLYLDYNSLKALPMLNENTLLRLTHLSLRGNLIATVHNNLRNFVALEFLDLSENALHDSKQTIEELGHLAQTLTILTIDGNPVMLDRKFETGCKNILHNLVRFNSRTALVIKPKVTAPVINERTPLLSVAVTNGVDEEVVEAQQQQQGGEVAKLRRVKPSKERLIMFNDDNENVDENDQYQPSTSSNVEIQSSQQRKPKRNFFFPEVSGSYGSYAAASFFIPESVVEDGREDVVEAEKDKVIQQRLALGENWLLNVNSSSMPKRAPNQIEVEVHVEVNPEEPNLQEEAKTERVVTNLTIDSEWVANDVENENTMFLVEVFNNLAELAATGNGDEESSKCFFLLVRPADRLLFEKDSTTGKILATFDLKIMLSFEQQPNEVVRIQFDTPNIAKQERVYRFLEPDSCNTFVQLYLLAKPENNNNFNDIAVPLSSTPKVATTNYNQNNVSNTNNNNFAYVCLRCGYRTFRIVTKCGDCGSELIIKDENIANDVNGRAADKKPDDVTTNGTSGEVTHSRLNIETKMLVDIDGSENVIDADYFQRNIDHRLQLHIELFFHEKLQDPLARKQAVAALCPCMCYDFATQKLVPIVVAITKSFIFLFDLIETKEGDEEDSAAEVVVRLRFYQVLVDGKNRSRFIFSHLPGLLKHQGYWLEAKMIGGGGSGGTNRRRKRTATKEEHVELLFFGDDEVSRAFLQLFLQYHRAGQRDVLKIEPNKLQDPMSDASSSHGSYIKSDITVADSDEEVVEAIEPKRPLRLNIEPKLAAELEGIDANGTASTDTTTQLFMIQSIRFVQRNASATTNTNNSSAEGMCTLEDSNVLMINKASIIIADLECRLNRIKACVDRGGQSVAASNSIANQTFDDCFELKFMLKESIDNLLPNIFLDKGQHRMVLQFQDEQQHYERPGDTTTTSTTTNGSGGHTPHSTKEQFWNICEYHIYFANINTLRRACQAIRANWEDYFGVSLTISKYA